MNKASNRFATIELLVKADNWDEVITILATELDIHENFPANDGDINGYYIARIHKDKQQISQDFFYKIKLSQKIGLLSDGGVSRENRQTTLEYIERIELRLRKMLIHISTEIEVFVDLLRMTDTNKERAKKDIIAADDIDPLTSHITFGGMIKILSIDISTIHKKDSLAELAKIVDRSNSYEDFQNNLHNRLASKTVWDVINGSLLAKQISWGAVKTDLNMLKDMRNKAAHFRFITDNDLEKVKATTKRLSSVMKPKDQAKLSNEEEKVVKDLFRSIYDPLDRYVDLPIGLQPPLQEIYQEKNNSLRSYALRRLLGVNEEMQISEKETSTRNERKNENG